jgi:hypothetical protein
MSTIREKKIEELLSSDKLDKQLEGIAEMREKGNVKLLPAIFKLLRNSEDEKVKNEIAHFLFDIKDKDAIPYFIKAIEEPAFNDFQRILVSACWESSLDFTPYLLIFVNVAINADYLTCVECLTVVENMEGPFEASHLDIAIKTAKEAADESNEEKFELLNGLWEVLVDFKAYKSK